MPGAAGAKSQFERFRGTLGTLSQGGVSFQVDPVRGKVAAAGADAIHRTLSCRTESSREKQPPAVPFRRAADEPTRILHRLPRAARRPPQVLLPAGCMNFLTIRR